MEELLGRLKGPDSNERANAAKELGEIGDLSAVPYLAETLHDIYSGVQGYAAEALKKIAAKNPGNEGLIKAIPALKEMLQAKDDWVAGQAAGALGGIVGENQGNGEVVSAIHALTEALKSDDIVVRSYAADAVARAGKTAVPGIVRCLGHENWKVREMATKALLIIAGKNPGTREIFQAVPALVELLKEKDYHAPRVALAWLHGILDECKTAESRRIFEKRLEEGYDRLMKMPLEREEILEIRMKYAKLRMELAHKMNELSEDKGIVLDDIPKPPKKGTIYQRLRVMRNG